MWPLPELFTGKKGSGEGRNRCSNGFVPGPKKKGQKKGVPKHNGFLAQGRKKRLGSQRGPEKKGTGTGGKAVGTERETNNGQSRINSTKGKKEKNGNREGNPDAKKLYKKTFTKMEMEQQTPQQNTSERKIQLVHLYTPSRKKRSL